MGSFLVSSGTDLAQCIPSQQRSVVRKNCILMHRSCASPHISRNDLLFPANFLHFLEKHTQTQRFVFHSVNMSHEDETITIPEAVKLSVLRNQKKPLVDCVEMASQYVCQLAALPSCPSKSSRRGGMMKCQCIREHFSDNTAALAKCVGRAIIEYRFPFTGPPFRILDDCNQILANALFW
jgi:hypothetical protein